MDRLKEKEPRSTHSRTSKEGGAYDLGKPSPGYGFMYPREGGGALGLPRFWSSNF